jgi:peroxiredoxin Q/BCP
MARWPDVGDVAPDFTLPSSEGPIHLHELLRDNAVLLVFYPKDDTLVCTRQLCNYRDHVSEFADLGVQLVGVNHDDLGSHEAFAAKHKLPFPLCSDGERKVCNAYGALGELWKARRVLVLVGEDGRIWWRHAELRVFRRTADELLQVIRELRAER